ncbi:hypothetical protein E2C01_042692 [Portunus trituberculatus]|uniref:Uncharacterized protein n=1 Tax=Portunus trituberculatus TaxID=210409 RepID=A0A5B7FTP9_PORTR|nr:hypothetical protein [Portunus trituberculatus]
MSCTKSQKCRLNTTFVKTSYLCVFKVFCEKKIILIENLVYLNHFTLSYFKTIKLM